MRRPIPNSIASLGTSLWLIALPQAAGLQAHGRALALSPRNEDAARFFRKHGRRPAGGRGGG